MSREDRIISKLEGAYDFIEYVNDNYPHVLIEWKDKIAGVDETPANADVNNPGEGNDYKRR